MKPKSVEHQLLPTIKSYLPKLKQWLTDSTVQLNGKNGWSEEDAVYRFYHYSFKVTYLQSYTKAGLDLIQKIALITNLTIDPMYLEIVSKGIDKEFNLDWNDNWAYTRIFLEAFWHTKYFIEMMVKYGELLEEESNLLDNGWASVLTLFNCR